MTCELHRGILGKFRMLGCEVRIVARRRNIADGKGRLHWTRDRHAVPIERCKLYLFLFHDHKVPSK